MAPLPLDHLDWLRRELTRPDGSRLAYWQAEAVPQQAGRRGGAYRDAGSEGGTAQAEAGARAALVYAQALERTSDAAVLAHAREALTFVHAMSAGDGSYHVALAADGRLDAAADQRGTTWATARCLYASAVGARVFAGRDPAFAAMLRADAGHTVEKLLWETVPRYHRYAQAGPGKVPAWFLANQADATALAVLGLATLQQETPSPATALLLRRYAEAIATNVEGDGARFPYHAHLPGGTPMHWQARGAYMLQALATAGRVLHAPQFVAEARQEAQNFTTHLLINGGALDFTPMPHPYPQTGYAIAPQVGGLLALYDATGEARYGKQAGLFASWLTGDNPAHTPMFDAASGRAWDAIDGPGAIREGAGTEATAEALLTLEALLAHPRFLPYMDARPVSEGPFPAAAMLEGEASEAVARVVQGGGAYSNARYALIKPGETLRWTAHTPGEYVLIPVFARAHKLEGERTVLRVSAGGTTQAYRPVYTESRKSPLIEAGFFPHPVRLKPGDSVVASYAATARQNLALDGLMLQPSAQARAFRMGQVEVVVARNYADHPRAFAWPGVNGQADAAFGIRPHQSLLIERTLPGGTP